MAENTTKIGKKPSGVRVDAALHDDVFIAARRRGTNLEGAYDQALRAWLGESDPARDAELAEFARFRQILAEAKADPTGVAASVINILRANYGDFSTPTQARAKGKK